MAARDFIERTAFDALEKSAPVAKQTSNNNPKTVGQEYITRERRRTHDKSQSMVVHNSVISRENQDTDENANQGGDQTNVVSHMKQKLTNNFEHYSNIFQGLALPLIFRKSGRRSRSNSRSRSRSKARRRSENGNGFINDRLSDDEDFVFVENIELYHMDGFLLGSSQKEVGRGHNFHLTQLSAPTWCDKCGDFIWGAYKQCLKCKCKLYFSRSSFIIHY